MVSAHCTVRGVHIACTPHSLWCEGVQGVKTFLTGPSPNIQSWRGQGEVVVRASVRSVVRVPSPRKTVAYACAMSLASG